MSSGYAILMDIDGITQKLDHTPKLKLAKRLTARKTWMIQKNKITTQQKEQNF